MHLSPASDTTENLLACTMHHTAASTTLYCPTPSMCHRLPSL